MEKSTQKNLVQHFMNDNDFNEIINLYLKYFHIFFKWEINTQN